MRAIDVSRADRFVVDKDGTIWFAEPGTGEWGYLSYGPPLDWRAELPEQHEPYVVLDSAAAELVRLHLITEGHPDEQR